MVFPSLLAVMYFFSLFIYLYPEPTSKCTVLLVHFGNFCVFVTAVCFVLGCGQLLCVSYLDLCVFSPRSLAVFWMPKCQACRLEGECERVARSDLFTAKQIRTVVILNYRTEKSLRVSWHVAAIIVYWHKTNTEWNPISWAPRCDPSLYIKCLLAAYYDIVWAKVGPTVWWQQSHL